MNKPKEIGALKEELLMFEKNINESIQAELRRIGRTVQMDELPYTPFDEILQPYVDAIGLDEDQIPFLNTSFRDCKTKYLYACITDGEITHWDMIAFLGMLQV